MRRSIQLTCLAIVATCCLPVVAQTGKTPFETIAEVLRHPRCLNCHPVTDYPRQGEAGQTIRHRQLVVRGRDNHGAETLRCGACHQDRNTADGFVPGAPNWHLAPLSMGWEGLNDRQLCEAIKDRSKNGARSIDDLVHHMTEDALVLWAWNPGGGRETPLPLETFRQAVHDWADAGAPCP